MTYIIIKINIKTIIIITNSCRLYLFFKLIYKHQYINN